MANRFKMLGVVVIGPTAAQKLARRILDELETMYQPPYGKEEVRAIVRILLGT
jgi:hypothetical protein